MCRNRFCRLAAALLIVAEACVQPAKVDSPPEYVPPAHLAVRIEGSSMDLAGREINMVPGDSMRLRAVVENRPEAYSAPVITASDASRLELMANGAYNVRRVGTLSLTATAVAKSSSEQPQTLIAFSKISMVCTAEMRAGIVLTVLDSVSGAPLASEKHRLVRSTGAARVDSARVVTPANLILAGVTPIGEGRWGIAAGAPGPWTVEVEADGYRAWHRDGVLVSSGLCGVITAQVTARLALL
jgi:hypothetical protein